MSWPIRIVSIVAAIVATYGLQIAAQQGLSDYFQRLVVLAGLYVTLAVSLNLINGITGQFSIGHAAFYQVGAYGTAFLAGKFYTNGPIQGVPWLILMAVAGGVLAALAGFAVGLPSLRLRGDYLAIVTLGFGEIIRIVVQNVEALGGAYGLNVPLPAKQPALAYGVMLAWLLAILTIAVSRNLLKTAHGLSFLAVREDEVASSAMGVNVTAIKVAAFVLGSAFAGAAGALLAHFEGFITPQTFRMDVSFIILTMVVLGGTGSITGSAVAAVFLSFLPEYLRDLRTELSAALVLGGLLMTGAAVAVIKKIMESHRGTPVTRGFSYIGVAIVAAILVPLISPILSPANQLAPKGITGDMLRMVIFAVTLIVLMLLRPQGVFAHHEFSWSFVRRLFGEKNVPKTEVSA